MHLDILGRFLATITRRRTNPCSGSSNLHFHLQLCVRILITSRSRRASVAKSVRSIDSRLHTIQRRLTWFNRALLIDFANSGRDLLLLDFFERYSLRDNINEKLKVIKVRDCACCGILERCMVEGGGSIQISRYWILRRGFRSDLTTLWACSARYWTNSSYLEYEFMSLR